MRQLRTGLALVALLGFCVFVVASVWPRPHDSRPTTQAPATLAAPPATPTPTRAAPVTSECTTPGVDQYRKVADLSAPGGAREIWIHRPAGHDSARLPVLYLLGDRGTTDRTAAAAHLGRLLDREMCRTGIPFVVAVPDGSVQGAPDPEWGDASDGRFALEQFVTATVIHLVEGSHRRPAALRAIGGFGMGGFGATSIALRHTTLYTQIASFGGWYRMYDPDGVFAGDAPGHTPDQLIGAAAVQHQRYFLAEGTQEATPLQYGTVHGEADRFAALVRQRGVTADVRHPVGGHDQRTWDRELPGAVRFLDHNWTSARTRTAN
ncbi:MAG TPA: alpha/beta hydrolase-fold protein [Mycobacteriales bacterium]|nr:alpha/beta hydrolase-fold protein [Mycobacteriales bacterium]